MILDKPKETVVVGDSEDDFQFRISTDSVITDILSDKIYSNKKLAVIREYSCNARDANVDNGKEEVPIRITLPNRLEKVWRVRDFGKALSPEEVKNTFVCYGESTKRDSNTAIGMFGIGSKAGFAYGSSFVIAVYKDGKRRDYSAFKDNGRPKMSLLQEVDSDEPTGIEIQIPVRSEDIESFKDECLNFFRHWKVRPEFLGATDFEIPEEEEAFLEGSNWKIFPSSSSHTNRLTAVMGGVPYPIDIDSLTLEYYSALKHFADYPIVIEFEIGDLNVNAGREGLAYDDRTKDNIIKCLSSMSEKVSEEFRQKFDGITSMMEAKLKLRDMWNDPAFHTARQLVEKNSLKIGEIVIGECQWTWEQGYSNPRFMNVKKFNRPGRYGSSNRRPKPEGMATIPCSKEVAYIINDGHETHGLLNRIAPLLELEGDDDNNCLGQKFDAVYLIDITDQTKYDEWNEKAFFDAPTVKFSELKKVRLKEIYGDSTSVDSEAILKAQKTKIFTLDINNTGYASKRDAFESADVDLKNGSGLYVVIDRFFITVPDKCGLLKNDYRRTNGVEPRTIINLVKDLMELKTVAGVTPRIPTVYAVRQKDLKRLGPKMKCFFTAIEPQVRQAIINPRIVQAKVDSNHFRCEVKSSMFLYLEANASKLNNPEWVSLFKKAGEMRQSHMQHKIKVMDEACGKYGVILTEPKPTYDLSKDYKALVKRYPLLSMMKSDTFVWGNQIEHISGYMNALDAQDNSPVSAGESESE